MVSPFSARRAARAVVVLLAAVPGVSPVFAGAGARPAIRAALTTTPPVIDGRLDEPEWQTAEPVTSFTQSEPREGDALTERTAVRVLYDRDNLYIAAYCYDSEPSRIIINELQRDFDSHESDSFGIAIDAFLDRRSSFTFFVNPGGAKRDAQALADGRYVILQWDGIWETATAVQADGWSTEIVIPFKTLGVRTSAVSTMGVNFKRRIRRKNEEGYWSPVPRRFTIQYMTNEGELTGLGEVATGGNLRVKPFVTADIRRGEARAAQDRFDGKVGVDLKYRVAQGLALDVTYNTDFSQAEVDRQQVNLTRFNLFFPEKRDFFLENAGIFTLGDVPNQRSGSSRDEETQLFYTRRIGLSDRGEPLALLGGVRLSGRTGPYSIGVMNIHQRADNGVQANNFTVARVRRDLFRGVDFGGMTVYRRGEHGDYNLAYGVDFNARFKDRLTVNGYRAATRSPGRTSKNDASQVSVQWEDGFTDAMIMATSIGDDFNPQVGFVPRTGVRNYQFNFGMRPRPRGWPIIREIHPHTNVKVFQDHEGHKLTGDEHYALELSFHDGGRVEISHNPQFERLSAPFRLPNGVTIPVGDYTFDEFRLAYSTDKSRLFSGSLNLEKGGYYDGDRTRTQLSGTVLVKPRFSTALSYEYNEVRLPAGDYRADLFGVRSVYSFSPKMFADAYVQHNTSTGITLTNVRFNFTYRPLSDFIVVYNETQAPLSSNTWRAFVIKFTRLMQF